MLARNLSMDCDTAMISLEKAATAFQCTSPLKSKHWLNSARTHLIGLRRRQTAILGHIDEALKSLT